MNNDNENRYRPEIDTSALEEGLKRSATILTDFGEQIATEKAGLETILADTGNASAALLDPSRISLFVGELDKFQTKLEEIHTSLTMVLGTTEMASTIGQQLQDHSLSSVFDFPDIADQALQLMEFGTEVENLIPTLEQLSQIAAGTGSTLKEWTTLFNEVKMNDSLELPDISFMESKGVEVMKELSDSMGIATEQIKILAEEGALGFAELETVMESATGAGGKFADAMQGTAEGCAGLFNLLKNSVADMISEIAGSNAELILSGKDAASQLIANYDTVATSLQKMCDLYGSYKAIMAMDAGLQDATQAVRTMEEAKSLEQLLTTQQRAAIAGQNLKKGTLAYAEAIKKAAVENVEAARTTVSVMGEEAKALHAVKEAAKEKVTSLKNMVTARQAELAAARQSGDTHKIVLAQKELDNAVTQRNSAVTQQNAAMKEFYSKKAALQTASQKAATASTVANTAANNANAMSTNLLAVAKQKLAGAMRVLMNAMKANPILLMAAAVTALVYGIYKLATRTTEAEKATKRLKEASKELTGSVAAEQAEIATLFQRLKNAKEGTEAYERAKKTIQDKYGSYLEGLSNEISSLKDIETAYQAVSAAALQAARDKQLEKSTSVAAEQYGEKYASNIEELQKRYHKKYGKEDGEEKFQQLRKELNSVDKFADLSEEVKVNIDANLMKFVNRIISAKKAYNDEVKKAASLFGPDDDNEITFAIEDPKEKIKSLKTEIDKIDKTIKGLIEGTIESTNVIDDVNKLKRKKADKENDIQVLTGSPALSGTIKEKEEKDKVITPEQEAADEALRIQNAKKIKALAQEQAILDLQKLRLDGDKDSYDKIKAQQELQVEQDKLDIRRRIQELIEEEQEAQRATWEKGDQEEPFEPKAVSRETLSADSLQEIEQMETDLFEKRKIQQEQFFRDFLNSFKDYATQREDLEKKLTDTISRLNDGRTDQNNEEVDSAIAVATQQINAEIAELDGKMTDPRNFLADLFEDTSNKTVEDLRNVANEAQELLNLLKNGKWSTEVQAKFNISEAQFDNLAKNQKELKNIQKSIHTINQTATQSENAFGKMSAGIKSMFEAGGDKDAFKDGLDLLNEGMTTATGLANGVGGALKNIGELAGNDTLGGIADGIGDVMDVAGGAMDGAQAGAAFGPIGAMVGAAVGLASSLAGKFAENAAHRKMLREQIKKNQMEDYLAEMDMNVLWRQRYDWAQKIGESTLKHIRRQGEELTKQASENAKEQEELMAKLLGTEYKANEYFKKTGLFGWGKGKIVEEWESLAGKSWEEIELLAAQNKLSEDGEKYYEALKKAREEGEDLAKRQEEYLETVRETFSGSTYDSVVEGIVQGFKDGKKTAADFADTFEELMQNAVGASIQLLTDEKMRKWYEDFASKAQDGLTENSIEELKREYMSLLDQLAREADLIQQITGVTLGQLEDAIELLNPYDSVVNGIIEGFKSGKRSADDFADSFESLMQDAVANSLKQLTDEKMKKWYEKLAGMAQDGLTDSDIEAARQEYLSLLEELAKEADAIEQITGVMLGDTERTTKAKGIATASQESVDELNGRFTVIQSHTYHMNENVALLANNSSNILNHLAGIETNTEHCQRLETIQTDMKAVRGELQDMNLKGITLKK